MLYNQYNLTYSTQSPIICIRINFDALQTKQPKEIQMKTTTTATKPATKAVVASIEKGKQALTELSQAIVMRDGGNNSIKTIFEAFRKTKVAIGDLRTCPIAKHFASIMGSQVNPENGKSYTAPTIANYLSDMRKALQNGGALVLNSAQKEAREKAKAVKLTKAKAVTIESNSEAPEPIPSAPSVAERTQSQKLYASLNTALLIAQSDTAPSYDVVKMTKGLSALIALIPA
jgi:hypothetical protein